MSVAYSDNEKQRNYNLPHTDLVDKIAGLERQLDRNEATADRRKELLRRAYFALRAYNVSHGTPHTDLLDELAKELANE